MFLYLTLKGEEKDLFSGCYLFCMASLEEITENSQQELLFGKLDKVMDEERAAFKLVRRTSDKRLFGEKLQRSALAVRQILAAAVNIEPVDSEYAPEYVLETYSHA